MGASISQFDHSSVPSANVTNRDVPKILFQIDDRDQTTNAGHIGAQSPRAAQAALAANQDPDAPKDYQGHLLQSGQEYVTLLSNDGKAFTIRVEILKQSPIFAQVLTKCTEHSTQKVFVAWLLMSVNHFKNKENFI